MVDQGRLRREAAEEDGMVVLSAAIESQLIGQAHGTLGLASWVSREATRWRDPGGVYQKYQLKYLGNIGSEDLWNVCCPAPL